jgi:uncharacterized membrane protein HdeD (DUF308 family)
MQKLWFKNKEYGWGWYPASKEGWVVLLVYAALFALGEIFFFKAINQYDSRWVVTIFIAWILVLTISLITIAYKTGEKPKWQWGKKK